MISRKPPAQIGDLVSSHRRMTRMMHVLWRMPGTRKRKKNVVLGPCSPLSHGGPPQEDRGGNLQDTRNHGREETRISLLYQRDYGG
jgi:hypothetical protein